MLDIDFADLRKGAGKIWPVGLLVGVVLAAQLVITALLVAKSCRRRPTALSIGWKMEMNADGKTTGGGAAGNPVEHVYPWLRIPCARACFFRAQPCAQQHACDWQVLYTDFAYPFQVPGSFCWSR